MRTFSYYAGFTVVSLRIGMNKKESSGQYLPDLLESPALHQRDRFFTSCLRAHLLLREI